MLVRFPLPSQYSSALSAEHHAQKPLPYVKHRRKHMSDPYTNRRRKAYSALMSGCIPAFAKTEFYQPHPMQKKHYSFQTSCRTYRTAQMNLHVTHFVTDIDLANTHHWRNIDSPLPRPPRPPEPGSDVTLVSVSAMAMLVLPVRLALPQLVPQRGLRRRPTASRSLLPSPPRGWKEPSRVRQLQGQRS